MFVTDRPACQGSLFAIDEPTFDPDIVGVQRFELDEWSWLDHLPGWLAGADHLYHLLARSLPWQQRQVRMYDRMVDEPRLVWWSTARHHPGLELLADLRVVLSRHYGVDFDSVAVNWYRDGRDSVAWHGDRIRHVQDRACIAIVSVGEPRPFLVRPRGGRVAHRFLLGGGDLLVMGGACQRDWEHCVPKVARAGPRMSVTYRHGHPPPR